ncbi:MAG: helix-turn-helix domain-containing protein [Armatimonadetes bacterium]|nr:helix-turn-helix domain-containing protein [Armatimonadota bacterium]
MAESHTRSYPPSGFDRKPFMDRIAPISTLQEVEREHILDVLEHVHGNRTQAARVLGVSRETLRQRLRQYGDDRETATEVARKQTNASGGAVK